MVTTKTIFFCLFLALLVAGCSPEQKAQKEKILEEHGKIVDTVTAVGSNATEVAIQFSRDYLEAIKDNNIDSDERTLLRRECEDRQLLSNKLNEEIPKFRKYTKDNQAVLMQAGAGIEEDNKLLQQAEDSLRNAEGPASLCEQLFGKMGGEDEQVENEEIDFKVNKAASSCKKIGEDEQQGYWKYEVTLTGEAWGPIGTYVSAEPYYGSDESLECDSWSKQDPTRPISYCIRGEGQPFKTSVTFMGHYRSLDLASPEAWLSSLLLIGGDTEWLKYGGGYYVPIGISIKHPEFKEAGYDLTIPCEEDDKQPKQPPKPLPCSAYWNTEWDGDIVLKDGREGIVTFKLGQPKSACENIPVTAVDLDIDGKEAQELGIGSNHLTCGLDCTDLAGGDLYLDAYCGETCAGGGEGASTFLSDSTTAYEFDKNGNAVKPVAIVGTADYVYTEEGDNLPTNHKGRFRVSRR